MWAVNQPAEHRLEVVEMPTPQPGPGEIQLRILACGICGSDLSSYKRGLFSGVPGHEIAAVVEAVGDGVGGWRPGEPVAITPSPGCGSCEQCRQGDYNRCILSLTGTGTTRPGGFAQFMVAAEHRVRRLPAGLAPEVACLAEPLAVALHGIRRSEVVGGQAAVVMGLGSIGLLSVAALAARGVGPVHGVDPVERRRELALRVGAAGVFARVSDARADLEPPPLVLECSGHPDALQQAIDLAAPGGRVVLLGIPVAQVTVIPVFWITREITVTGSINSKLEDFEEAIEILASEPAIGKIVTHRVSLAEVPDTFERLLQPNGIGKVVVDPWR